MRPKAFLHSTLARYGLPVAAILIATVMLLPFTHQINSTTVALTFLLIILCFATFFGRNPALLASFVGMLCFNYFFLHPLRTWYISAPENLVAWAAFTITAVIAGEMSTYAKRRAEEAERLYGELQTAFDQAAHNEALRQSEKLKSALLDAVTHDLRTPLTSIKAAVTTLLDSEGGHRTIELDGEGRGEFLSIINEETDRLNKFIEGMVALARLEAGALNTPGTSSSVEEIVATVVERAAAPLAGHQLTIDIANHLPPVSVDARSVAEALYNLVENAAKYSPRGSTITITAASNDDRVSIGVMDEGRGIPVEMRERVFEKFVRIDGQSEKGLGLGLAIARGIVEAQNGTIGIMTGDVGKGVKVVLTLPAGDK